MPDEVRSCPRCGRAYDAEVLYCPQDGAPVHAAEAGGALAADPRIGLVLPGDIVVRELVGVGVMSRIYRAEQRSLGRDVAVKFLRRELGSDPDLVRRFHREAKVVSRLASPHVVALLMSGDLGAARLDPSEPGDGADLYLVMELCRGVSLRSLLAAARGDGGDGALPLGRALHIALALCAGVGAAHAMGIVHRDLKPDNVMLVEHEGDRDFVKVLDFGIARLLDEHSAWTQAGLVFGSAAYVSPEGALGERVGPAADVYAIATVLYECLAGRTPFQADAPVKLLLAHAQQEPPALASLERAAYVPAPIADAIMANLAKDPAARSPDADALGAALRAAMAASGVELEGPASSAHGPSVRLAPKIPTRGVDLFAAPQLEPDAPPAEPEPSAGARARERRRRVPLASLLALATALALVAFALGRTPRRDEPPDAFEHAAGELRRAVARRAWDAQEQSVRTILGDIGRRWPADARLEALRRETAERALAEALGHHYAGRRDVARVRASLARELVPDLEGAAGLLADLDARGAAP
jgi:serine/threonine-protein kinase